VSVVHAADEPGLPMSTRNSELLTVTGLLMFSLGIRLYAFLNTPLINPDGAKYINQAKALLENNWVLARSCGYDFLSLYHLLIPVSYGVFGDWIFAAQSISLFFGTISVIPLYLTLRQFFRQSTAVMACLAFSINPFFVSYSVELVKDPICWFFALLGIFFFASAIKHEKRTSLLLFSSVSFLIAALARLEILSYFLGSVMYILFYGKKKFREIILFTLPVFILACLVMLSQTLLFKEGQNFWTFYFLPRVQAFFKDFGDSIFKPGALGQSIVWLQLLAQKTAKVLYLPFVPFSLIGFLEAKKGIGRDGHFRYLILLSLLSVIVLYFFYIKTDVFSPRYTVSFVLPGFIFFCFGFERISLFFQGRGIREKNIFLFAGGYTLIAVLLFPSNLIPVSPDKIIYKRIGEYIAERERNQKTLVAAPDNRVIFYANLHASDIECRYLLIRYDTLLPMHYTDMVSVLKTHQVKYFLWEEKAWKNARYDFLTFAGQDQFKEVMRWNPGQERLILFEVRY
jgi:4-amino-4-deoxy-L-arabinose transferase-like glycosyltransferase